MSEGRLSWRSAKIVARSGPDPSTPHRRSIAIAASVPTFRPACSPARTAALLPPGHAFLRPACFTWGPAATGWPREGLQENAGCPACRRRRLAVAPPLPTTRARARVRAQACPTADAVRLLGLLCQNTSCSSRKLQRQSDVCVLRNPAPPLSVRPRRAGRRGRAGRSRALGVCGRQGFNALRWTGSSREEGLRYLLLVQQLLMFGQRPASRSPTFCTRGAKGGAGSMPHAC